ncbi:DUF3916 domain-containing protein [Stutzerimonas nitrititolerans]|uniref:DUF3916 domain-containing protein n=1 Tax=Stutzerimonas nitrititolerans TaxID=2482751 RepID=UPI001FCC7B91|nr:DUF3916 domain-containing protein [Stutzerimonas nitrititolerans]
MGSKLKCLTIAGTATSFSLRLRLHYKAVRAAGVSQIKMTNRRLTLGSNEKLRGIPRRLRALARWAGSFDGYFPSDQLSTEEQYWNWKIPVDMRLVEGRQTNSAVQAECAQRLIDAAHRIFQAKPRGVEGIRVTSVVVLPCMFTSELCIYTSEIYFKKHTEVGRSIFGEITIIKDRSLAREWGLVLPEGFGELGVMRASEDCDGDPYYSEHWYFGEVSNG